jgi:hypothetical protein
MHVFGWKATSRDRHQLLVRKLSNGPLLDSHARHAAGKAVRAIFGLGGVAHL